MFKTTTRLLALSLLLPGAAMADVLLERTTAPGHVMAPYAVNTSCTLDDQGVLAMDYRLIELNSHRAQQTQLSVPEIQAAINEAVKGTIQSENMPVDGETVIYRAFKKKADGTYRTVVLWEENGGSGVKRINQSTEAMKLKNFIDLNCSGALQF